MNITILHNLIFSLVISSFSDNLLSKSFPLCSAEQTHNSTQHTYSIDGYTYNSYAFIPDDNPKDVKFHMVK